MSSAYALSVTTTAATTRTACGAAALVLMLGGCTAAPAPRARQPAPAPNYAEGRSQPVADTVYPQYGNPSIDVLHYDLDLGWAPETTTLTGTAELTVRAVAPLTEVVLDFAAGLAVSAATVADRAVTPRREGDKLVLPAELTADRQFTVGVRYSGVPKQVPTPSTRPDAREGLGLRPSGDGGAWTMQEPYGAFTWYPCSDQPSDEASYEIRLSAPAGWVGVANGSYQGVRDGKRLFRSTEPTATYVTTLAFGKYTETTLTGPRDMPISLWTRAEDAESLASLRKLPEHLRFLEERFGEHPMSSAGVVMVPSGSAMETQEMITMGGRYPAGMSGDRLREYLEATLVHELAHQYFGNAVTPKDWRDVWLNEGWATYADGQYQIEKRWTTTEEWVADMRRGDTRSRAVAGPPGSYDPKHFAAANVYVGPALMLHEIRGLVGDEKFFALGRDWVQTQRHSHQDRASFTAFATKHTGQDLSAVIAKWLDSPTTPAGR